MVLVSIYVEKKNYLAVFGGPHQRLQINITLLRQHIFDTKLLEPYNIISSFKFCQLHVALRISIFFNRRIEQRVLGHVNVDFAARIQLYFHL